MAQVTLYMDDETLRSAKAAAKGANLSVSAWLRRLVQAQVQAEWPAEVRDLAGAWRDLPAAEALRAEQPEDLPRETL